MDKETSIEQLKHFLKEMFQFNTNDLGLGGAIVNIGSVNSFLGFPTGSAYVTSKRDLSSEDNNKLDFQETKDKNILPADYLYINHTSFLREVKQQEFQELTNVRDAAHYDIRVIIDSYYKGALERIKFVQYYLHDSYPQPIIIKSRLKDKFCLKEIANGEYVLTAKVFFKDISQPLILERYITLWNSGPKIEN